MKFSACLEMLFTEVDFVRRIPRAKRAGFDAVEFWLWQNKDLNAVKAALRTARLGVGVFQGNTEGRMIDPKDKARYVAGVRKSVEAAKYLGAKHLFLMADLLKPDRSVEEAPYPISPTRKRQATLAVLKELSAIGEQEGITFVIEPLNTLVDHRGYSLAHSAPAFDLVREVGSPNVRVLYDVYHMQIMEGNIIDTLRANIDLIGYVHIADVPGRHEPGTGELNYRNIFKALTALRYQGHVGFEFAPTVESRKALREAQAIFRMK